MHYFLGNILIENPMVVILHKRFAYWKFSRKLMVFGLVVYV